MATCVRNSIFGVSSDPPPEAQLETFEGAWARLHVTLWVDVFDEEQELEAVRTLAMDAGYRWIRELPEYPDVLASAREQFEAGLERIDLARSKGEFPDFLEASLRELRARLVALDPEFSG
jgi:hypothetical protein